MEKEKYKTITLTCAECNVPLVKQVKKLANHFWEVEDEKELRPYVERGGDIYCHSCAKKLKL